MSSVSPSSVQPPPVPFRSLPFASVLPQHRQIRYVYKWGIDKDAEYWDVSTNILGSFTFAVKEMRDDLEKLYRDTLVVLMFKKCLEQLDVSAELAQITWTNKFADFNSFPMQKHLGKISAYLNEMSGVTMKLGLDENGELNNEV